MIIITNYTVVHLVGICILFRKSIVSLYSKVAGNFMQEAQNDLSSNHGYLKYLFKRAFEKYDSEYLSIYTVMWKFKKSAKIDRLFFGRRNQNNSEYFYYIVMELIPKSRIRISSDSKRSDSDRIGYCEKYIMSDSDMYQKFAWKGIT